MFLSSVLLTWSLQRSSRKREIVESNRSALAFPRSWTMATSIRSVATVASIGTDSDRIRLVRSGTSAAMLPQEDDRRFILATPSIFVALVFEDELESSNVFAF